jgi:hypothetical protein
MLSTLASDNSPCRSLTALVIMLRAAFACKRLGNTPFRREGCVVKWLVGWKTETENVSAPPHPRGSSAASSGVCKQRHETHRVLSESGFELRHAGSSFEEATLEERTARLRGSARSEKDASGRSA